MSAVLTATLLMVGPGVAETQEAPDGWALEFRIGDSVDRPEYMFGRVADMAFGPNGNVHVLDASDATVNVYDASGAHLRSFGGRGDGPGESQFPNRLVVTPERVKLYDPSQDRVAVFSSDGEHVETRRLREVEGPFHVLEPLRDGVWLGATTNMHYSGAMVQLSMESARTVRDEGPAYRDRQALVVALIPEGGGDADTIFTYDHGFVLRFKQEGGVGAIPRYWGLGGDWTMAGDSIVAVVDGFRGAATTYRIKDGTWEILWENRLPLTPKPLGESDWQAIADAWGGDIPPGTVLVGPEFQAQVGEPLFADDGALWIRSLDFDPISGSGSSGTYFVLDAESEEPRVLQVPDGFVAKAIRGDLVLGQRQTEMGVDLVELWRVEP